MKYFTRDKEILIKIPASTSGKFRFKTRNNNLEFGEIFSTRKKIFNKNVYLEWQISYDATLTDVKKGKKVTNLKEITFVGSNGKEKYPYELSELLYKAVENKLIPIDFINSLLKEIKKYKEFISDREITVEKPSKVVINGIPFEATSIKLPTLFMIETTDNTQIEVSIQKQQYASGVQPMLYFCIPISSFRNCDELYGRSSNSEDYLIYVINESNAKVLFNMFKIFAMCSPRHNYDMVKIIEILIKLLSN